MGRFKHRVYDDLVEPAEGDRLATVVSLSILGLIFRAENPESS